MSIFKEPTFICYVIGTYSPNLHHSTSGAIQIMCCVLCSSHIEVRAAAYWHMSMTTPCFELYSYFVSFSGAPFEKCDHSLNSSLDNFEPWNSN